MKKIILCAALAASVVGLYAGSMVTSQPQTVTGGGAATSNGDYVSANGALNTFYRYFVEVPPGQTRLKVDIFDADIGLGGAAEATAGRDRDRGGFDTTATYTIIAPDGTAKPTVFTTGDATAPVGADNAWLTFFDWTGDFYADNFGTNAYTNNDGSLTWSGNWIETNDDNNATAGQIRVTGGELRVGDNGGPVSIITRQANLSAFTTATFSFVCRTTGVDAGDQMAVEVSGNGGTSWTRLETFTGPIAGTVTKTYNITAFKAANTQIRFIEVGGYGNNDFFFVDNLQIKDSAVQNGHWEIRVNQTSASTTTFDDINAFAIRASDGDTTAAGTELNLYADSFIIIGQNPPAAGTSSRTYTFYPYITSGCKCAQNDFDYDSDSGTVGSVSYASNPDGTNTFPQVVPSTSLSTNNTWRQTAIGNWTNNSRSTEYGLWTATATINTYLVTGNPNGNYATFWNSNDVQATPTPTSNPQTNAFRIYFPTDSGAKPSKPYLEQRLVQRGSGPLNINQPKTYTVTIRMVNPAAFPITFSAAKQVTANVPGAGAVYAGNAVASQGTVTSQPAVNNTGNITWNPGTVAAGATVLLSYDVKVTAPSGGVTIPVTGTAASGNGTRATYVDLTGNTTQARATYTFGPLCELAAVQGTQTEVLLSSFDVKVHGNATLVKWDTASEAATVGFNLYRVDAESGDLTLANDSVLAASAPQGGHYRFVDKDNTSEQPSYVLEELTADGRALQYGPFAGSASQDDEALPDDDYDSQPRPSTPKNSPRSHAKGPKPAAAIAGVSSTGVTRINAADLADALLLPQAAIDSAIKTGRIAITEHGSDVAWTAGADNDSILFFGQANDSIYSNERAYRVSLDRGTQMNTVDAVAAPETATTFVATEQFENDNILTTILPVNPDSDYWYWDVIISGNKTSGTKAFNINVPAVASGDGATLQIRLQGSFLAQGAAVIGRNHHAAVSLNGIKVGDLIWPELPPTATELPIPSGALHDGPNVVTVQGILDKGVTSDVFYIDGFAAKYTRSARAVNGILAMTATPGSAVTATSLSSDAIALDVTQPAQPAMIRGGTSFVVPAHATSLFFSDASAIHTIASIRSSGRAWLTDRKNGADYVVITNDATRQGADALAGLRSRDGLQTLVVDVDDIYDEFANGNVTPHAIHDFLAATRNWSTAPRYVALAGIGTLDYRGLQGDPGLIPPIVTTTSSGLFAADGLFGDFDGDGIPEIAIGRIPASTNDELLAYVAKLQSSADAPKGAAVFSADTTDKGANFKRDSGLVESQMGDRLRAHIYLDEIGAAAARTSLLTQWQNGASFVNWIGHSGLDRLSSSSILTVADANTLSSTTGGLPILVAMTCVINRFELPFQSLGTALSIAPNAGALAVWSASGLSAYNEATQIELTFMRLAANADHPRLGDLTQQALAANKSIGETANVYLLLGDPALPLNLPAPTPVAGNPSGGIE